MANKNPEYLPSLGRVLKFASESCSELSESRLASHGLTLAHWVLLTALWRQEGMTVGELTRYYRAKPVVLTRTLDRMVENGFVLRVSDPGDRRVIRIWLTNKAKKLAHLVDFYQDINDSLLKGFTKREQDSFYSMLERVIVNAGEALENESGKTG